MQCRLEPAAINLAVLHHLKMVLEIGVLHREVSGLLVGGQPVTTVSLQQHDSR